MDTNLGKERGLVDAAVAVVVAAALHHSYLFALRCLKNSNSNGE